MKKLFLTVLFIISSLGGGFIIASDDLRVYNQFTESLIDVGNTTLFCRSMGQGTPLIVLHGGPGLTQDYLLPELAKLSENHLVVFYDQRGCGKSSSDVNPDSINIENYIHDLDAIRQHFGFEKISILGHSWGGFLAMKYAIVHPESVDKLILANSMSASSEELALFVDEWVKRMAPYQGEIDKIRASKEFIEGDTDVIENYYRIIFRTYCYFPENADLLNLKMSPVAAINGAKVNHILRESVFTKPFNLHEALSAFDIPTLVIHGEADPIPLCTAENLHMSILNSTYVLMKKCGHFPYIEDAQTFFRHINSFLGEE